MEFSSSYVRVGVVGVLFRAGKVLAIQRSASVAAPLKWCFPGGGIEGEETPEQALIREFQEELGITIQPIRHLEDTVTPWRVFLSWWMVDATDEALQKLCPDPDEVRQVAWMTLEALKNHPETLESNLGVIEHLLEHFG